MTFSRLRRMMKSPRFKKSLKKSYPAEKITKEIMKKLSTNVTDMAPNKSPSIATIRQRKYRAKLEREGYKRLDLNIPAETWEKLKPHLSKYGGDTHPGKAIVGLLGSIRFKGS